MNELIAEAHVTRAERGRGGTAQVFETLREEIITLRLAPGTVLSRVDLQSRFGLSSTPIRDALMRLQEEALVEIFPQHATVVSPIDVGRARQAQFLRRSVELEVVATLARHRNRTVIDRLRSIIRQQTAFAELEEHQPFNAADLLFHRTMHDAAGILEIWQMIRRQCGHIDRLRHLNLPVEGKMQSIVRDHTAIVDGIDAGSPDQARAAMRDHLSKSLDFVSELKGRYPNYFRKEDTEV
jgi:GntR family transcriptional regulator, rspAB operon transcriptional repressor